MICIRMSIRLELLEDVLESIESDSKVIGGGGMNLEENGSGLEFLFGVGVTFFLNT